MSNADQLTSPELIQYAKAIVIERAIPQAEMTKEIMGEILQEAMRRMDRAVTKLLSSGAAKETMAAGVYFNRSVA